MQLHEKEEAKIDELKKKSSINFNDEIEYLLNKTDNDFDDSLFEKSGKLIQDESNLFSQQSSIIVESVPELVKSKTDGPKVTDYI